MDQSLISPSGTQALLLQKRSKSGHAQDSLQREHRVNAPSGFNIQNEPPPRRGGEGALPFAEKEKSYCALSTYCVLNPAQGLRTSLLKAPGSLSSAPLLISCESCACTSLRTVLATERGGLSLDALEDCKSRGDVLDGKGSLEEQQSKDEQRESR